MSASYTELLSNLNSILASKGIAPAPTPFADKVVAINPDGSPSVNARGIPLNAAGGFISRREALLPSGAPFDPAMFGKPKGTKNPQRSDGPVKTTPAPSNELAALLKSLGIAAAAPAAAPAPATVAAPLAAPAPTAGESVSIAYLAQLNAQYGAKKTLAFVLKGEPLSPVVRG